MADQRPDPEKLLQRVQEEARKEHRGKLKIYLGAAPGVGKTHEMLHDAMQERAKGLDVVVGVVESHGRKEIEELLKDLDILPRQMIEYRGKQIYEFDLDDALRRRPGLILMDEMAHSNAPGLRHSKRWQDIKELIDRGINVYTTLNVQHIESLNDDVAQIIHAPIQETVPDSMIEMADTIELIDLPPDDLLKRLKEGKVYIPQQAELAAEHFFRKGNLNALRELALRVTAERVDAEILLYRQGVGIKHIWPTRDKILVCVGPKPESAKLIRAAKRIVNSLQAAWIAIYVDAPRFHSDKLRNEAIQHLHLAEQLGAETHVVSGTDIVKEVINFARENNVTQILIWKHIYNRWHDWFRRNLADELVRASGEIDIYIMTGLASKVKKKTYTPIQKDITTWKEYIDAIGIIALATAVNFLLYPYIDSSNLIMGYLLAVTFVAMRGRSGPSIMASFMSVVLYDYCFFPPFFSFAFNDIQYIFTLITMLLVTQVISQLAIQMSRQAEAARFAQHQTSALYTLSRQLSSTRGINKLIDTGTLFIASTFHSQVLALLPVNNHLEISGEFSFGRQLEDKEQGIANWVYELGQMAGLGTDTLTFSKALFVPLLTSHGTVGVLRIQPIGEKLFTPNQIRLLDACANQIAIALDVDSLHESATQSELKSDSDLMRNALFQSVSHDIRVPLLSIMASARTQLELSKKLTADDNIKLAKTIYSEGEHLNHLINNLLQISYLESKTIKLQKQELMLNDTIKSVLETKMQMLGKRQVNIKVGEEVPKILYDNILMQDVFANLLDNAIKYTPVGTPIDIHAVVKDGYVIVSIEDRGNGVTPEEIDKLFEKFYRSRSLASERGLGLGLAVCRLIIEAHGGKIWAENREGDGAVFRFQLPLH